MLGAVTDIFRLRQYFDVLARARELAVDLAGDVTFVDTVRRAVVGPHPRAREVPPVFAPRSERPAMAGLHERRIAIAATGGSGALASVVGVAKALEDAGVAPVMYSTCSGSALYGFPLAAGRRADEVAAFTAALTPDRYIDTPWRRVAGAVARGGKGFGGFLAGERLEATYREWLGDLRLGELPIACYAPIWCVEDNRVEYLGPATYPDVTVARAVRMAVSLPLFFQPVELGGKHWGDGGIVDIFPVHPMLDIEPVPSLVLAVNGFYPPEFAGEDETGWDERALSILYAASQVRTCQQVQLARENLARLAHATEVLMLEPVPYERVRGLGFYRQFLATDDWPAFMRAGRRAAASRLRAWSHEAATPAA